MLVIEEFYLRKHSKLCSLNIDGSKAHFVDASFAENFYGLKRRRRPFIEMERAKAAVGGVPQGEALTKSEIWRSLGFLVCRDFLCLCSKS